MYKRTVHRLVVPTTNRTNAYAQDFVTNDTLLLPILKTFIPDYRTYLVKIAIMLSRPARLLYTASLLQRHTAPWEHVPRGTMVASHAQETPLSQQNGVSSKCHKKTNLGESHLAGTQCSVAVPTVPVAQHTHVQDVPSPVAFSTSCHQQTKVSHLSSWVEKILAFDWRHWSTIRRYFILWQNFAYTPCSHSHLLGVSSRGQNCTWQGIEKSNQ
jgi:hypothetical protein